MDCSIRNLIAAEHLQQARQTEREAEDQAQQHQTQRHKSKRQPAAAHLPVEQPLRIYNDSVRTVQTGEGMAVSLAVEPNCSPTAVLQWLKDGEPIHVVRAHFGL